MEKMQPTPEKVPEKPSPGISILLDILREAIKAVPAIKYAWAVVGLAAAVAIIASFKVITLNVAAIGIIATLPLMVLMFIFVKLVRQPNSLFQLPIRILLWSSMVIFILAASLILARAILDGIFARPLESYTVSEKKAGRTEEQAGLPLIAEGDPQKAKEFKNRFESDNDLSFLSLTHTPREANETTSHRFQCGVRNTGKKPILVHDFSVTLLHSYPPIQPEIAQGPSAEFDYALNLPGVKRRPHEQMARYEDETDGVHVYGPLSQVVNPDVIQTFIIAFTVPPKFAEKAAADGATLELLYDESGIVTRRVRLK